MNNETTTLDVREEIRQGREPFSKIMETVAALQPDQGFLLIAPFEPVPLFSGLPSEPSQFFARHVENLAWPER